MRVCRVAEASAATLREMNPFVQLAVLGGPIAEALTQDRLKQHDLVLLCGQPAYLVSRADRLCTEAGVAFYAATCRGISGWAFANLHDHEYIVEVSRAGWVGGGRVGADALHLFAWTCTSACVRVNGGF